MKKDIGQALVLIMAFLVPLAPCVQPLYAAYYADPANEFVAYSYIGTGEMITFCPAIHGNVVVWYDDREGVEEYHIYGKNLSTGEELAICTDPYPSQQIHPDIYGNIVVWEQYSLFESDIYGKNLNTGETFPICTESGDQSAPAIYGNIVVWLDSNNNLCGKNISSEQQFTISTASVGFGFPDIHDDIVVWPDYRNGNGDIYGADISDPLNPVEFVVCNNPAEQHFPAIHGDIVTWCDERNEGQSIYGKNLSTGEEFPICVGTAGWWNPAIYGDIVLWEDFRNGEYPFICAKDITTGQEFPISTYQIQWFPAIYDNIVVFLSEGIGQQGGISGNRILPGTVQQAKKFGVDRTGATSSDPVNTGTGNFYLSETDVAISGPGINFEFGRVYNTQDSYCGPFGPGWTHSYNVFVAPDPCSEMMLLKWGDGQGHYYLPDFNDANSYHPAIGAVYDKLKKNPDNTWTVTQKDLTQYQFDTNGKLNSIIDKNGNTITLAYDENGLDQIIDTAGRIIDIVCDSNGLIQSVTDPNNRQNSYGYTGGKLTSVTDPRGNTTYYTYDVNHEILKTITNNRGIVDVNNIFDSNDRVIQQIDGRGNISSLSYDDPCENQTTITDPLGRQTVHIYDPYLRIISITDPCGYTISYTYDNKSNCTSITDQKGNIHYFSYDERGNVLTMTAPQTDPGDPSTAAITTVTYDPNTNNPRAKAEATGSALERAWAYQYDPNGNLIRTVDPNGNESLRTYTAKGLLATETDKRGNITKYTYDANDNLTDVNDALGNITNYTYDAIGRLLVRTDARGNTTTYSYDENDNLLSVTDPNGETISYTYDENGNKTTMTDRQGKTWEYHYSENNILTREVDSLGFQILYGYDDVDNLISVNDKNGNTTLYSYDLLDRLIDVNDPSGHHTSYTYDSRGNMTSMTNALGKTQTYEYDTLDRIITETDSLSNTITYEYDLIGRIIARVDANSKKTKYNYDELDRLIDVNYPDGTAVAFIYDKNGNLTGMTDPTGTTTYTYDPLDRITSSTDSFGKQVQYGYDIVGNRTSTTYPADSTNPSHTVTYTYDKANRLDKIIDWEGRTWDYTVDETGRITQLVYPNGVKKIMNYDVAGRLSSLLYKDSNDVNLITYSYTRDAQGNPVEMNETGTLEPSIDLPLKVDYTYDNDNRLISSTEPAVYGYDNNGNLTTRQKDGTITTFTYDFENRLTSQKSDSNSVEHVYDGLGNRIARIKNGVETRYVLDRGRDMSHVLCETDGSGEIVAYYIHGPTIVGRIGTNGSVRFYHTNHIGSIVALTDTNETVTDCYAYTPFGVPAGREGSTPNPFTYVGGFGVMAETDDLYFMRARFYDTDTGRFLSKDPVKGNILDPATFNGYTYVQNYPTTRVDPSGEIFDWILELWFWHEMPSEKDIAITIATAILEIPLLITEPVAIAATLGRRAGELVSAAPEGCYDWPRCEVTTKEYIDQDKITVDLQPAKVNKEIKQGG